LQYLSTAENVDVTDKGTLTRRAGYALQLVGAFHSLWSDGGDVCVVRDGYLTRLVEKNGALVPTQIKPVSANVEARFVRWPTDVLWTNGQEIGRIAGDVSFPIWPAVPATKPSVSVSGGGSFPGGLYQLILTAVDDAGRESPASQPVQVEVPDGCAVIVSAPGTCRVYMTPQNGDEFFRVGEMSGSLHIPLPPSGGARCVTRGLAVMPPGDAIAVSNGRLLVASGNVLYRSEPYSYGLYNPVGGHLLFPADITLLAPCGAGVYVAADKTYWLADDALREVLPYGAAVSSALHLPDSPSVAWYGERGLVIGDPTGSAQAVQADSVACEPGAAAALLMREENGLRQLVANVSDPRQTIAGVRTFFELEYEE
jgi:hypothetical protein